MSIGSTASHPGESGDPRLRPQRGGLLRDRRPATGRRLPAGRGRRSGADVVVVNTCAFVASAKKDSIDTVLAAADTGAKVVAVGCLAERYGAELAAGPARGRRRARLRRLPRAGRAARRRASTVTGRPRTPRWTAGCCCRSRPVARPAAAASGLAARARTGVRPDPAADAAALRPGGPAEDRLRLRPALHVLRHPVIPRRVRLPAVRRDRRRGRAGWPSRASGRSCWSARTRPPSARTCRANGSWRTCSPRWPRCPASPGCGCPTCSRPRPGRG